MKVIATALGYGGKDGHQLRQPGDVFEVADGEKASWFEPLPEKGDGAPGANDKKRRNQSDDLA